MKTIEKAMVVQGSDAAARVVPYLRLGIVGCGPRGLQCLEALSRRLTIEQLQRVHVIVFEPAAALGAGRVYDPAQPRTLRMNFATQHIDLWKTSPDQKTSRSGSLLGWLSTQYPEHAKSDQYIPRAIVGEYLRDCFDAVHRRFEAAEGITFKRSRVDNIYHDGFEFKIVTRSETFSFDRLVLTTGHEGLRSSAALGLNAAAIPALPCQPNLSPERVPSGSRVLVRGFGLTAIDAVLSMTEGRGGVFISDESADEGILPRYISGPNEPLRIDVRSRSGRPMLAKPTAKIEPINDAFWLPFRKRLTEMMARHGQLCFQRDVWPIIIEAAASMLNPSGSPSTKWDIADWYGQWSLSKMNSTMARRVMLQSYAVAMGKRPIDIPFAVGDAWRRLYPELVRLVSNGGLSPTSWKSFADTSREMERIAFGPPAESLGRLLTLIRKRVVTIGIECGAETQHDFTVNAVIAGPHEHSACGPLQKLLDANLIQTDPVSGGVMIDSSGSAIGPVAGLAILGRSTEGWVVGNDTLSRTIHDHIENWADAISSTVDSNTGR